MHEESQPPAMRSSRPEDLRHSTAGRRHVLLFGAAAEVASASEIAIQNPRTVSELRTTLIEACPQLATMAESLLVAVDHRYAEDSAAIPEGAEVAVFPPVSGG